MVYWLILDRIFSCRRIVVYEKRDSRPCRLLIAHRTSDSLASTCELLAGDELCTVEADIIAALCAAHYMIVPIHADWTVVLEYRAFVFVLWSDFAAEDLVLLLCVCGVDYLMIWWCKPLLQCMDLFIKLDVFRFIGLFPLFISICVQLRQFLIFGLR